MTRAMTLNSSAMTRPVAGDLSRVANDDVPFVTCTWSRDVHYAKALLGSIHHFYPDRRIIVIAERDLCRHEIRQLRLFPNTEVIPVMNLVRRHKLHFVGLLNKLNILFLPDVTRAIFADADSVLVDTVADRVDWTKVFTSLCGGVVDLDVPEHRASFDTWAIDLEHARKFDDGFPTKTCRFLQSCHFAVNTTRFPYDLLFASLPHLGYRHGDPKPLRAGDQGFWNLLVNWSGIDQDAFDVLSVTVDSMPTAISRFKPEWNNIEWITDRSPKEISFIHYIGAGRRFRRNAHVCPRPLTWGTALYYDILGRRAYVTDEIRRTVAPVLRKAARLFDNSSTAP